MKLKEFFRIWMRVLRMYFPLGIGFILEIPCIRDFVNLFGQLEMI